MVVEAEVVVVVVVVVVLVVGVVLVVVGSGSGSSGGGSSRRRSINMQKKSSSGLPVQKSASVDLSSCFPSRGSCQKRRKERARFVRQGRRRSESLDKTPTVAILGVDQMLK